MQRHFLGSGHKQCAIGSDGALLLLFYYRPYMDCKVDLLAGIDTAGLNRLLTFAGRTPHAAHTVIDHQLRPLKRHKVFSVPG